MVTGLRDTGREHSKRRRKKMERAGEFHETGWTRRMWTRDVTTKDRLI